MKKLLARYRELPIKTRQLLRIGIIFALVAALPLFVWAILTQRFDIREKASTGEIPPPSSVYWRTPHVLLTASDFYIDINGVKYLDNTETSLRSDPPNSTDPDFTTLELTWQENGVEMRLFMYFRLEGNVWSLYELRTYDGNPHGEWLYYNQGSTWYVGNTGQYGGIFNPIDFYTDPAQGGHVHFNNISITLPGMIPPPTPVVTSFPTPTPPGTTGECQVCSGFAGLMCVSGLICQEEDTGRTDGLDGPIPDLGGICVKPDGSSNCDASPSPTPSTPPQPKPLDFRIKFGGVSDGSADGAKATIRFVNSSGNYITSPIEFSHIGDGVYQAIIMPMFAHLLTSSNTGIGDYTFYVKGEKHAANKFCTYSQDGPCQGAGSLVIPYETAIPMPYYNFTGYALEPGDLPPQDGKVDSVDFGKVTSLMGKLCSELTEEEKHTADLDYNGCVNIRDAFLIRKTLETKYDEY